MTASVGLEEFRHRRKRLMKSMGLTAIAVLPGAQVQLRSRDTEYPFRQDSDFHYLTGFNEPESVLVLAPGRDKGEAILFCRERDRSAEQWTGERLGPERAEKLLGVDDAFPYADLGDILPGLLEGRERIYVTLGDYPDFDRQLIEWVANLRARGARGAKLPGEFMALSHLLHEQRLFKSDTEQSLMSQAASITARAHVRAMQNCEPGLTETQLEAELMYEFMRGGARAPAYSSIVASGDNACVMHYVKNDSVLKDGDLVLIDAGCEYEHYAADLTRTFPVGGTYTPRQRDLYEIVLKAQIEAIRAACPGADFNAPHNSAIRVLTEGLIDLGILDGDLDEAIGTESYRRFTVHNCSHWLGIDVHDVGDYRVGDKWRMLEAGMVITVEPGLYIPDIASFKDVRKDWRGIGIRIEDDVLIEKTGNKVLTTAVPKTVEDIEVLMNG